MRRDKYLFTILGLLLFLGCQGDLVGKRQNSGQNAQILAKQSTSRFNTLPRTTSSVLQAYQGMTLAIAMTAVEDSNRYDYLALAAKYATWLSYHLDKKSDKIRYANEGIVLAKQAIAIDKNRVEGFYYRAISTGLFAQEHKLSAKNSMNQIRRDLTLAIKINPGYDDGGPHRILGALYLRAPGPPMGPGSRRKAILHLEAAYQISMFYPENILFLAEAYIKVGDNEKAKALLGKLPASFIAHGDSTDHADWQQRSAVLYQALNVSN